MSDTIAEALQPRHHDRLFIGGEWTVPSTASLIDVVNPATEEVFLQVAEAKAEDVERAVGAARTAFDKGPWPWLSHAERATYLRAIATAIRSRSAQLAALHSSEMGILYREAQFSIAWCADLYDYYADMADSFPFVERHEPSNGGKVGLLVREPVGVVGAIIPWNSAMNLIVPKLAPALLAGCTFVLKASPEAPGEAYVLAEILESAGLPPGVVNVVTAERKASEALVRDARVDKIAFTGSSAVGRRIASMMGDRIGRYSLELGGKSAAVVLDDCDIVTTAGTLAASGTRMTGQVCASLTRIVVTRKRRDELVEALSEAMSGVKVGDPFDHDTGMGPLATRRQREIVEGYVASGLQDGAKLTVGGGRPEHLDRGFFVEPTLFADVDNSSKIAQEEIFGPVLSVITANDESHAVDIANDSIYGLNATVFSDDIDRVYDVARRLRSGTVGHNAFRGDFHIAFGGFKQSGIGREGGQEGIHSYVEVKTVILDDEPSLVSSLSRHDENGASS